MMMMMTTTKIVTVVMMMMMMMMIKHLILAMCLSNDVALTFFRSLKTFRLTFLRMRNKCKITNVQRNKKAFSV